MSKHNINFDGELRKLRKSNRPGRGFRRLSRERDTVGEFCHLVKKFPRDAARSREVMELVATRFNNPTDSATALEAVQYLFEHEPGHITFNQSFGTALEALANGGHFTRVREMLKQSARDYPKNIASNTSMLGAFRTLIRHGEISTAGKLTNKIAIHSPHEFALNPNSGQMLADLILGGDIEHGVNSFLVLGKLQTSTFSKNKTLQKVIKAINKIDLSHIFGESKSAFVREIIGRLVFDNGLRGKGFD